MQLKQENKKQNKKNNFNQVTFLLTAIGMVIAIAGNFCDVVITKKLYFLFGGLILFSVAVLEKNLFFSVFEFILTIGAAIAFLSISPIFKSLVPICLGIIAAIYFGLSGQLKDHLTWLSVISVLLGAWGFALTNPYLYFWCGAITATYSFFAFKRGERIALAFGVLNVVFCVSVVLGIYHLF